MKHFREYEFRCPCGCGLGFKDIDQASLGKLQVARELAGVAFMITSSIRCVQYNRSLPKASETSSHLYGCAFDIYCSKSSDRWKIVDALMASGFTRIGIGKDFIHADDDEYKPQQIMWVYS